MTSEKHNINSFAIVLDEKGGILENIPFDKIDKSTKKLWINLASLQTEEKISLLRRFEFVDDIIKKSYNSIIDRNKLIINEQENCFYINLYGTSAPKSIINLKILVTPDMIITIGNFPFKYLQSTYNDLTDGYGPKSPLDIFLLLTQNLFENIYYKTYEISEEIDALETKTIQVKNSKEFDNKIFRLRRELISIHRYIIPQKEVFQNIKDEVSFLSETKQKNKLKEISETINNIIDNSEYARKHIIAIKDELENNLSININNNMYIITLLVAIFTPISLVVDLIGIDLSVLFKETDYAFALVCGVISLISLIMFMIIRKFRIN
ncbi:MAG: CorA family divalent cation transporter [Alphaproteobacteria bacterium]